MLISKIENFVLPQGWSMSYLPDFTDIVMGQSPTSDTYNKSGSGIPFFQGKAEFGAIYPTVAKYCSAPNKIALSGATLLSVRAPVGPTNMAKEKCCIGRGLAAIHPAGGISPMFVLYLLRSIETDLSKEGTGSTFSAINKQFVEELEFGLPPLPEQHRIVAKIEELFSELDKGIENLKTAQAQLKVYRQALLKHAFEGKLTAQWRAENQDKLETAEALLKRIQQERAQGTQQQLLEWEASGKRGSKPKAPVVLPPLTAEELAELAELPEGWGWFKVAHICDVVRGGSPRPAGDPKFYDGDIPFLKVADITTTSTPYLSSFTFTITEAGLSKTRQIRPNTLLLSNSGATLGVPKICLISATMNDGVAAFLGLPREALLYHYYFWESKTGHLRNIDQGAAQPNLNTDLIKETFISICSPSEQLAVTQKLEAALSEVDQLELTITTSLQQAEALRQSILKKAFSGQLVPQDPHDEPASALLARIRALREQSDAPKRGRKPA